MANEQVVCSVLQQGQSSATLIYEVDDNPTKSAQLTVVPAGDGNVRVRFECSTMYHESNLIPSGIWQGLNKSAPKKDSGTFKVEVKKGTLKEMPDLKPYFI